MHCLIWCVLSILIVHKYVVHCRNPNLHHHPWKVDTHGLYVSEAKEKLSQHIEDLQASLGALLQSQMTDHAISNALIARLLSKGGYAACMTLTSPAELIDRGKISY